VRGLESGLAQGWAVLRGGEDDPMVGGRVRSLARESAQAAYQQVNHNGICRGGIVYWWTFPQAGRLLRSMNRRPVGHWVPKVQKVTKRQKLVLAYILANCYWSLSISHLYKL
jgi:hypothetical protein